MSLALAFLLFGFVMFVGTLQIVRPGIPDVRRYREILERLGGPTWRVQFGREYANYRRLMWAGDCLILAILGGCLLEGFAYCLS